MRLTTWTINPRTTGGSRNWRKRSRASRKSSPLPKKTGFRSFDASSPAGAGDGFGVIFVRHRLVGFGAVQFDFSDRTLCERVRGPHDGYCNHASGIVLPQTARRRSGRPRDVVPVAAVLPAVPKNTVVSAGLRHIQKLKYG